ncbi:MAG: hypothetical protein WBE58_00205 [Verrucomicrobiales bacterium]
MRSAIRDIDPDGKIRGVGAAGALSLALLYFNSDQISNAATDQYLKIFASAQRVNLGGVIDSTQFHAQVAELFNTINTNDPSGDFAFQKIISDKNAFAHLISGTSK